ncbi:hypothetical protein AA313_de0206792 [Arthrobotrys entomopaga]|nr:hypothetical protein AA313_de0206792 [Arthrobotrys entomopaga]
MQSGTVRVPTPHISAYIHASNYAETKSSYHAYLIRLQPLLFLQKLSDPPPSLNFKSSTVGRSTVPPAARNSSISSLSSPNPSNSSSQVYNSQMEGAKPYISSTSVGGI